jgi:hypothetical protein
MDYTGTYDHLIDLLQTDPPTERIVLHVDWTLTEEQKGHILDLYYDVTTILVNRPTPRGHPVLSQSFTALQPMDYKL